MPSPSPSVLRCPACSAPLTSAGLDVGRGIAKCAACGALMTLPATVRDPSGFRRRPPAPLPPRIRVEKRGVEVEIVRRWFTPVVFFLVPFAIAWDAFLVGWYTMATHTKDAGGMHVVALLFPIGHVGVGVFLTYAALCMLLNTTTIRIRGGALSIAHRPMPWRGNRTFAAGEVEQLWCKDVVKSGKSGPSHTYEVWAVLADGKTVKLLAAGLESEQALFLEQEIESALGIEDRAVAGEMAR